MRAAPGVRVIDVPQATGDGLPRMDVPVFVGFAERGPLHRPVLLEDAAQYEAVFGGTLDLVVADDGSICQAHLSAAVGVFFAGGGQRCHVIRVAGQEVCTARLEVPGVTLAWRVKNAGPWNPIAARVLLRATSPGAWADRSELSARLRSASLLEADEVGTGEVLRIRHDGSADLGYLRVAEAGHAGDAIASALAANGVLWMASDVPQSPVAPAISSAWRIERLSVDLAVRQPAPAYSAQTPRAWMRKNCALAQGALGVLPWFEPDVSERLDAGLGVPSDDWPLCGMLAREVSLDAEPFDVLQAEWMVVPTRELGAFFARWSPAEVGGGDALDRNGLAEYSATLFLDPAWNANLHGSALLQWADQLRYFDAPTRRLQGAHAALGLHDEAVREATWLAVPDATHVGWRSVAAPELADGRLTLPGDSPDHVDSAQFELCAKPKRPPAAPHLALPAKVPADTSWFVWIRFGQEPVTAPPDPLRVEVQIAASADFSDQRPLLLQTVRGAESSRALDPTPVSALPVPYDLPMKLPAGLYFVRARAWRSGLSSAWSAAATLNVRGASRELLSAPAVARDSVCFQVHAAMIDLAGATREHFALLSVPADWDEAAAAQHVRLLRARFEQRQDGAHAASFAAIHHPWLQQNSLAGPVSVHPPEGALLAQYAKRTRARGSWAAAGLDPLALSSGVAGSLDPALLEAAGCNPIEVRPRGVNATRAATLDVDDDWSAIGVRRLLISLRKLARREGDRYAFEPNDMVLRRSLERSFDELLRQLLQRGALRGSRASEAYALRTARGEQLKREIERGECSLEIRVAPSLPLRFLTLYAVRSGDEWQIKERS